MKSLTYFLLLTVFAAEKVLGATFSFDAAPVTTCEPTPNGICEPVYEYRVYDVTDGNAELVATSPTPNFVANYPAETGVQICFVATAYNGLESSPTYEVCVTPEVARPLAPSQLEVSFY